MYIARFCTAHLITKGKQEFSKKKIKSRALSIM